jgi:hypothetical protein
MGITTKIVVPPPGLLIMTTSLPNGLSTLFDTKSAQHLSRQYQVFVAIVTEKIANISP